MCISKLVSNGEVTKASLSLSQSIQYCMTNRWNQTTLGLGVKLHHKFGSIDLIDILNEHGYTVSYDEVLRFRKSAAKYVGDNAATLHRMMGFTQTVGLVFVCYDNFALLVSTPNGRRETHAMATKVQMHQAGIINGNTQPGICTVCSTGKSGGCSREGYAVAQQPESGARSYGVEWLQQAAI